MTKDENISGCPHAPAERRWTDPAANEPEQGAVAQRKLLDLDAVRSFAKAVPDYLRLYVVLLLVIVFLAALLFLMFKPVYTAEAVVGPPGPSPIGSLMASSGANLTSGLTNRVLGGANTGGSDNYQTYLQLLPSSRLAQELMARDDFVKAVFWTRWDPEANRWRKPDTVQEAKNVVKRLMGMPVTDRPGVDDAMEFFKTHLAVTRSTKYSGSGLLNTVSPYLIVTLRYSDQKEAERLLDIILAETDRIIREDQRRDVTARIRFLRKQLSELVLATDERSALISILSSQEQLLAMIQADHRFASTLVVTPYAPSRPTAPPRPPSIAKTAIMVATMLWLALVYLSQSFEQVRRFTEWSRRKRRDAEQ